jgi:tetratricopeptide (TPR) repeat protein
MIRQSTYLGISLATCLLAVTLLTSFPLQGQSVSRQNLPGATLQGSVQDSTGRPVAGATVYLQLRDGTQTLSAHADAAGNYRFSRLAEGIYTVRVEMAGYSHSDFGSFGPCVLGQNEAKTLDLKLESPSGFQSQGPAAGKPGTGPPEFSDEPQFTVAGVTDGTNLGGHGSNTVVRTKESLAKDVTSLSVPAGKAASASSPPASSLPPDPAEASLRAAADRQPGNFDANRRSGKALLENRKAPEAIAYLERAGQLKPGDYETGYLLAHAYADAGQYQRARTNARALLNVSPGASSGATPRDQSEVHHLLGDIEEKSGNPLEAVREYQRAAELNPSEANFFDWGSELLLHRAVEPAIQVFSKGNRLFPGSARMLVALGVAWYSDGSYDHAAPLLCQASDLNPNDSGPYLFLGKIQSVETAPSECSVEKLARFVKLQPQSALANYYYAVSVWKRRKGADDPETSARVESQLKQAVRLDPTLAVGHLQLGILYSEKNDFPAAISSYEEAIKASPELEEAYYRLAQAYKRTGEKSKAQQELQLYEQISKKKEEQVDRERRESQQFVYTLRSPAAGAQPQ